MNMMHKSVLVIPLLASLAFPAVVARGINRSYLIIPNGHDTLAGNSRRKLAQVIRRWKLANVTCFPALVFTALHVMQTRYSDENSVCLSVCLSVTRGILTKRKKDLSRFLHHTKEHLA